MTTQNLLRGFTALVAALVCVTAVAIKGSPAHQTPGTGKIFLQQVDGTVTVNGRPAAKGDEFSSGGSVTTAKGSSAVVSLGKLGRVEVLPESTMKLSFTGSRITIRMLDAGRVRVSSSSGTAVTATTKDGETTGDSSVKNEMVIDTRCGNTTVFVRTGRVDVRDFRLKKTVRTDSKHTIGNGKAGCTPSSQE